MMRRILLCLVYSCAFSASASAGVLSATQAPYIPPYKSVTQRAPLATDDATAGYFAAGSVPQVIPTALGSGYTVANTTASLSGGGCASYAALTPVIYGGQIVAYKQTGQTEGCTIPGAGPTVTIVGDGSGAAAYAPVAEVGAAWIDQDGVYYRMIRDTPGAAVWQRQFMPAGALPADVVPGAVLAYGEDKLHAGATRAYNLQGGVNAVAPGQTAGDIGFVGNSLDYAALDAFMGGVKAKVNIWYDQIGTNHATGQTGLGTLTAATVKTGGTGFASAPTCAWTGTLDTGGAAPAMTAAVSGNAVTGFTITSPGSKILLPGFSCTGGGGSGLTFSLQVGDQPQISPLPLVGNGRGVLFDYAVEYNSLQGNYRSPSNSVKFKQGLTIPNTFTLSGSYSVVVLGSFGHSFQDAGVIELSGSSVFSLNQSGTLNGLVDKIGSGGLTFTGYHSPITGRVIGVSNSATASPGDQVFANDGSISTYRSGVTMTSLAGGAIGCSPTAAIADGNGDGDCGNSVIRAVLVFSPALSATQYQQVSVALMRQAKIYPQVRQAFLGDGDSITAGAFGNFYMSWVRLMLAQLSQQFIGYDAAVSGQTSIQNVATVQNWISICSLPGITFYSDFIGTNDFSAGGLATTVEANQTTLFNTASAAGCGPMYMPTTLPRGDFVTNPSHETQRQALLAWDRANAPLLGASIIDTAADPTLGNTANLTNPLVYQDQTHPGYVWLGGGEGQGGYPIIAARMAAPINNWLRTH